VPGNGVEMPRPRQRSRISFAISHRELDVRTSVVAIEGDCDLDSAPRLKWALVDLLADGERSLILDLSLVTFMDSTALGALIGVQMTLSANDMLVIAGASPSVLRLFALTGVDRRLSLFSTLDAALTHVRQTAFASAKHSKPADVNSDDRSRIEHQRSPPTFTDTSHDSSGDPAIDQTALTRDAALALGVAATAVPFARSRQAQAERWLRVLRRCGGAGIALSSLGLTDTPLAEFPECATVDRCDSQGGTDRDEVATVTRHAGRLARHRGGSSIHTTDLLGAVIEVYGSDIDHLLLMHGTSRSDLIKALCLEAPDSC
jgi:anti-sigma B factor antagonist